MNDDRRNEVALFRLTVLGDLVHATRKRGALSRSLQEKCRHLWQCPDGQHRRLAAKTIQSWYYRFQKHGFDGLKPRDRRDRGLCRAISVELQRLVVAMKREDPGRSIPLIIRELEGNGLVKKGELRETTVARLLRREGLSGPQMELKTAARYRFAAATCGELWQGDACHGPKLFDPGSGREVRVKIFGLIDDKSRLVTYLRAGFHERQRDFLKVLLEAVQRRGIPRALLLDNHGSFTGADVRVACAKLGIRLIFARPYDGASKGKIERYWRTLRAHVLDRLDRERVVTLDDLNVRLLTYLDNEYNQRPHAGLSGKTPLSVWEEDEAEIRWPDEPMSLASIFVHSFQRQVRNDSTCTLQGKTYETPSHLRGRPLELCYSLLDPTRVWIMDGATQAFLREVDPVANSTRSRGRAARIDVKGPAPKKTGLNAVEDALQRRLRPGHGRTNVNDGRISHA